MASPFNADESLALAHGLDVTLVNGRTFAISDVVGSLARPTHGVIFEDVRILSGLMLAIDGESLAGHELLATTLPTPFSAIAVSRTARAHGDSGTRRFLIVQRRWIGRGYRHDIEVRNTSHESQAFELSLVVEADFAHLFEVKVGGTRDHQAAMRINGDIVDLGDRQSGLAVELRFSEQPTAIDTDGHVVSWRLVTEPGGSVTVSFTAEPVTEQTAVGLLFPLGQQPAEAVPLRRLEAWRDRAPALSSTDRALAQATSMALEDLASLRIFDSAHPDRVVVAAGAPWFMTLFGRDSLLTSWMTLPFTPQITNGVLKSLAELQGTEDDPISEEQPGRIIHELRRRGGEGPFALRNRYYGTVDATPLYLMVMHEAVAWGAIDDDELRDLWPSVQLATKWVLDQIELGPGGFIAYERRSADGLQNQGWKDSWDGVNYADGTYVEGPIALSEVQGYAYAGLLGVAGLARRLADPGLDPGRLEAAAKALAGRFDESFWLDERGYYALGVDRNLRAIDSLTTNPGHALWCGITDADKSDAYLDHLMSADMWTGWGIRTLAASMGAYDPLSYHNGSVWPHDSALCAAGAAAYGRWDVVDRIAEGLLDAALHFGGRPPELFAGISRQDVPVPVAYPASCSPQAWSSAAILLLIRTMLGLEAPIVPGSVPTLRRPSAATRRDLDVSGVRVGSHSYTVRTGDGVMTIARNDESS